MLDYFDTVDKLFASVFIFLDLLLIVGVALLGASLYDTVSDIREKRKRRKCLLCSSATAVESPAPAPDAQSFWSQQPPSIS